MNHSQFGKVLAFWLLLWVFLLGRSIAQDLPTVEKIREMMAAREAVLGDVISAKYSVSEKKLPGKNAWYRLYSADNPAIPYTEGYPDNSIECAYDCWLELNGARVKLAVISSNETPPYEEHYITDGKQSWHYSPTSKDATILADPISSEMLVERKPWLPVYLTTFPTHMTVALANGPTLSELLSPSSGNRVQVKAAEGGDLILEIRSAIRRPTFKDHDLVRRITLEKEVGFAPTHYVVYVQVGAEVFDPDIEASYEQFVPAGEMQVPRRIVIVTGTSERVRGKLNDPLKVADFQEFKMEELTVTIDQLTTAATFGPDTFVFKSPPGTTIRDKYAERRHALFLMRCRLLLVGGVVGWGCWYFRGWFPRRAAAR